MGELGRAIKAPGDRRALLPLLAVAAICVTSPASAQPSAAMLARLRAMESAPLTVKPLTGGAYWVSGGVSNTGFVVGDKGVVAIDPQMFAAVAKTEQAAIARITPNPVNVMILTHADPDHVNGLPGWPKGMEIIAQENAKAEIKANLSDTNPADAPPPAEVADYLPTQTIRSTQDVQLDGVRFKLIHIGAAHTDGDLVIYLPDQKIVFAGDLITTNIGPYPILHLGDQGVLNKHGSSIGWIRAMKAILALDAEVYVPGHGPMETKAQLQARLEQSEARRAQIKALFDKGDTLDEIRAALHETPPAGDAAMFPSFTETTYQELLRE